MNQSVFLSPIFVIAFVKRKITFKETGAVIFFIKLNSTPSLVNQNFCLYCKWKRLRSPYFFDFLLSHRPPFLSFFFYMYVLEI